MNDVSPTKVLLLGTFHFADEGHDVYKPQHVFDVAARQAEIQEVIERLAAFNPTKVAVEVDTLHQNALNRDYQAYLNGAFELTGHEVHQLGFKLAQKLKHPRVHAIDAWGRFYDPPVDEDFENATGQRSAPVNPFEILEARAQEYGQTHVLNEVDAFLDGFSKSDEKKVHQPLRQTLLEGNDPHHVLYLHGIYLVAYFKVGRGYEYPGVDAATAWYNRNLRIFANLQRITEPPDERLLVIYGLGHTSILRHCLEASPEYDLVEVGDYL